MACEQLVPGCFLDTALFAQHHSDAVRAAEYLVCCIKAQLTWAQVENQIRSHLMSRRPDGATEAYQAWVDGQVARAQHRMLPWFDTEIEQGGNVVDLL